MIHKFPLRNWKKHNLCNLIKRIDKKGEIGQKRGSSRLRSARTTANIGTVGDLICSQEDDPSTSKSPRENRSYVTGYE